MQYFEVDGPCRLSGSIQPQGAKNEALQILAAVVLTEDWVTVSNLPQIVDVLRMISLLETLGVEVEHIGEGCYRFRALNIRTDFLQSEEYRRQASHLRGSVMLAGPLLARFGQTIVPQPGGDKIGRRRLDTHFIGFQKLGAILEFDPEIQSFTLNAPKGLRGNYMLLDEASVTGTANIIMAAVLAEGSTTIYHAACEPYIQQLCNMLNRMGAKISGIGSNLLTINGVAKLQGTEHRLLSDMIEVGSFIGMAAITQSELTIENADIEYLGIIPDVFKRLGVQIHQSGNNLIVSSEEVCQIDTFLDGGILTISDHPWPGFTPDLLSIVLVVATQCLGTVLIHQKMFESRLFFTDKLIDMGAQIILCDPHRCTVIGSGRKHPLRAISMTSPDIRAGVALLMAAMAAHGKSKIYNIEQIDRGYQFIETRLNAIGAKITRKVS